MTTSPPIGHPRTSTRTDDPDEALALIDAQLDRVFR
jgi:hypothetical protein